MILEHQAFTRTGKLTSKSVYFDSEKLQAEPRDKFTIPTDYRIVFPDSANDFLQIEIEMMKQRTIRERPARIKEQQRRKSRAAFTQKVQRVLRSSENVAMHYGSTICLVIAGGIAGVIAKYRKYRSNQ